MGRHVALVPEAAPTPPLPLLESTVGLLAVAEADRVAASLRDGTALIHMGAMVLGRVTKLEARVANDRTIEELRTVRGRLGGLTTEQKAKLEGYLHDHLEVDSRRTGHDKIVDWLADAESGAPNAVLLEFLRGHTEELSAQQQSEGVSAAIAEVKERYLEAGESAMRDGWISAHTTEVAPLAEQAKVYIGDLWDRIILLGAQGYHYEGSDAIVIAQSGLPKREEREADLIHKIHETLPHELGHRLFGQWLPGWAKEALTEHVALGLMEGDFATLDPGQRANGDNGVYSANRRLMGLLLDGGAKPVAPDVATRAYTSSGPESREWRHLMKRLDRAWRVTDVLGRVTTTVKQYEQTVREYYRGWDIWRVQHEALGRTIAHMEAYGASL